MEKLKIVVILLVLFFAQKVHCEQNKMDQHFSYQNTREVESHFETNEFTWYNYGELPIAQVFFNLIPETSSSSPANIKTKVLGIELFHSTTKINLSLLIHHKSVFSRYCSAFIQIFLKTACFRL